MRRIRITESHDYDLVGQLVDGSEPGFQTNVEGANPFVILPSASIPKSFPAARLSSNSLA
jgi:hypothetical protein